MRRSTGPWTPAVHALLRHLERVGFEGAPRLLGVDEQGREILTYISGEVPRRGDPTLETDLALIEVGSLLRRYHEAAADFALSSRVGWHHRSEVSGPVMLVCHNDISPRNTVFRDGHPVAFLDWDLASPAPPAWDVVHARLGSSYLSPTMRGARGWAGHLRPIAPTACGSSATLTDYRRRTGRGLRSLWFGESRRRRLVSRHCPPPATRRTNASSPRTYQSRYA